MIKIIIYNGDNRFILKRFSDATFDSCVCDPPYELGFMGKAWDKSGIAYDVSMWKEVYRVLKTGAHLLAFGGSRTYHRLACAIEDAGFQIRDQIMWLYASGFPKSLDVSKGIDKAAGVERTKMELIDRYRDGGIRKNLGPVGNIWPHANGNEKSIPASNLARQWDGWGTALKPAHEPIVMARKPLEGTVVANVLKHGTGAINVAGCGIPTDDNLDHGPRGVGGCVNAQDSWTKNPDNWVASKTNEFGRWPANVIHDGSEEMMAEFERFGPVGSFSDNPGRKSGKIFNSWGEKGICHGKGRFGTAARFFYCAKASPEERNRGLETRKALPRDESRKEGNPGGDNPRNRGVKPVKNNHPTVKPLALMAYLVRLVTPPGGLVLDPFSGSGSTLIAAAKEGFDSVGIDLETGNCEIMDARCRAHLGMLAEVENR